MATLSLDALVETLTTANVLLFFLVLGITFVLGRVVNILVFKVFQDRVQEGTDNLVAKLVTYAVYLAGITFAFRSVLQVDLTSTLTALGILGIGLVFTFLPVLQNAGSGIALAVQLPFKEGDIIEWDGMRCKVRDIRLSRTELRSLSGEIVSVPNSAFMLYKVTNYSKGEFIKIVRNVRISRDSDVAKAKQLILDICSKSPNILPQVPEKKKKNVIAKLLTLPRNLERLYPKVWIADVTKDTVTLECWFWVWSVLKKDETINEFYEKVTDVFETEHVQLA